MSDDTARSSSSWVRICLLDELPDGAVKRHEANGMDIVVCRTGDAIYALENQCSHHQVFLHRGWMHRNDDGSCALVCPAHGAKFDPATGIPLAGPATRPIRAYAVRVQDGAVWVLRHPEGDPAG